MTAPANTVECAAQVARSLAGSTGSCSITLQHVDDRELWTVHAHASGASMQGQGGDLSSAIAALRVVGSPRLAVAA